jgi:hypothetical protein
MATEAPDQLKQLKRISLSLKRLFIFLFALTVFGVIARLLVPSAESITLVGVPFSGEMITTKIYALSIIAALLSAALAMKAYFHLIKLFSLYAQAKVFTADNVAQIRQLGITLMLAPAVWLAVLLAAMPEIAAATAGWLGIMPSFPGNQLIVGGIVILISWIMDVGRQLRDEHDLVI